MGGPRLLGLGHLEGLANDLGYDLGAGYACVPLDDGAKDPEEIDVLVGLLVHTLEVGLAGQGDERRAIEERVGDRCDEVGGPGPEGPEADTGAAREAADRVGHIRAALLVADRNELNRGRVGERFA